jgi:protein SCO1/2
LNRFSALLSAALVICVTGCGETRTSAIDGLHGVKFAPPHAKPDFTLDDTQGKPFHFASETHGLVTLVYFGYTNCPDVCPTHLANISAALKKLSAEEQSKVRFVFVTTDPNRDTPERLRSWLDNFDKRFIGVRGGLDSVNAIGARFGLPPATIEPMNHMAGPQANYGMGHGAQVLAFSADDSLRTEYPSGFTVSDWVNDIPKLAKIR